MKLITPKAGKPYVHNWSKTIVKARAAKPYTPAVQHTTFGDANYRQYRATLPELARTPRNRDEQIYQAVLDGSTTYDQSAKHGISRQRVCQIVSKIAQGLK